MKIVLYARVSSEKQDIDLSITAQLKALRQYALANGHEIVQEFVDEAESGKTVRRPMFQRMIAMAKSKPLPFQAIVVWKLSRFARNREDSILYKSMLRRYGVQVISVNERTDSSPTGQMMEGIIEVLDEFYSANLAQDVVRGMREAAARGFWVGNHAPFGYRIIKVQDGNTHRNRLSPDESRAWVVKEIFSQAAAGFGVKHIVTYLNSNGIPAPKGGKWFKSMVRWIVGNEAYMGVLRWGGSGAYHRLAGLEAIRVERAWDPIVDPDNFRLAQSLVAQRSKRFIHPRRANSYYLLSGLLYCQRCAKPMMGHSAKSSRYHYYICGTRSRQGNYLCGRMPIPRERLENLVLDAIREKILTDENIRRLVDLVNREIDLAHSGEVETEKGLKLEASSLESRLDKLYAALETGQLSIEDLAPRIKALKYRMDDIRRQLSATHAGPGGHVHINADRVTGYILNLRGLLDSGEPGQRKSFLRSFVRRVDIAAKEGKIEYSLPVPWSAQGYSLGTSTGLDGGLGRDRTCDQTIMSRPLYH